ncbi:MAG: ATP-binding protein [Candidatus Paceibacterota bacterium]
MDITTILPLVSAIFVFGLGIFVLLKNTNSRLNVTFFLHAIAISFWLFATFMMFLNKGNIDQIVFWDRMVYVGVVFIPTFMYHFCLALTNRPKNFALYLSYILAVFFLIVSQTDFFVRDIFVYQWGVHTKAQLFHHLFLVYFAVYVVAGFTIIYSYYRQEAISSIRRQQIKYSFLAFFFLFTIGPLAFLPAYGIGIYPFAYLSGVIFAIILSYAILRYRLMNIQIIARKIFIYAGVAVFAYFVFYLLSWVYTEFLGGIFTLKSYLFGMVIAPTFVFLLYKTENVIRSFANQYFFFALYNYQETINRVSGQLTHYTDLSKIDGLVSDTIKESLGVTRVEINLFDKNSRSAKKDPLIKYLQTNQRPVVLEELNLLVNDERLKDQRETFSAVYEQVENLGAAICLPMVSNERLIGIIILGPKVIGDPFTVEDLELLMTLSNQAAIAIDNAELYKEVKDFNKTLKQKVNEQTMSLQDKTKVLEEQAEHLKKLLAMRSEFLDIASHQLKTPISVISGTISMFKEGSVQKMPVETQNKLIDNIYQKSLKISQIIRDILQASEFDTEKFSFVEKRIVPVELNKLLSDVMTDNQSFADEKKLKLVFTPNPANPQVNSDPDYLEQAFFNLVDNALKYTKEGKVEVLLDENPQSIIIKVKDTGVGIPKDDQIRMFGKFERAKNAVDMYTDGSGLGLFITKEIIEAHPGGTVTFASEEGKGTEFTVIIPKTKK